MGPPSWGITHNNSQRLTTGDPGRDSGVAALELAIEEMFAPVLGPEKPHEGADSPWKLLQLLSHQPPQGNRDRFQLVLDE